MGNYCSKRRSSTPETDSDAKADSEAKWLADSLTTATRRSRRKGNVAVTVAITQSLSGDRVVLPTLPACAKMRELRELVKDAWKMPLVSQRFLIDGEIINAADADEVAVVFHDYLPAAETEVLELCCVRTALAPEEQEAVNNLLLLATASGDIEKMREALSEGAEPNCRILEDSGGGSYTSKGYPPPLLFAQAAGDQDAIQLLKDANAETPQVAKNAPTFSSAFRVRDLTSIIDFLGKRCDPNIRLHRGEGVQDTDSGTPLHALCAMHRVPGSAAVVQLLLRLRADPDSKDAEGDSPLAHAKYFGAKEIHAILQSHGAKLGGPYYSKVHRAGRAVLGWR
jgi:hypothetical protein